jgi:hypothetical protein
MTTIINASIARLGFPGHVNHYAVQALAPISDHNFVTLQGETVEAVDKAELIRILAGKHGEVRVIFDRPRNHVPTMQETRVVNERAWEQYKAAGGLVNE